MSTRSKSTVTKDRINQNRYFDHLKSPKKRRINEVSSNPKDIWKVIEEFNDEFRINLDKNPMTMMNMIKIVEYMDLKITNL